MSLLHLPPEQLRDHRGICLGDELGPRVLESLDELPDFRRVHRWRLTTGGPDLIENGKEGWWLPVRSPDRIRQALERLYREAALRETMGRAARARAEQFSWETYEKRAYRTYRGLIR